MANSEDAQDHLHAKTCQREARKGRARSLGKTLNAHTRPQDMQTQKDMYLQYAIMCYNVI